MFVALFVVGLVVVIMFHEFGHFATAKAFGMKVERFFLGFGPTLWSTQRGETEYGVKAIPAGGFVKIIGMNTFEPVDPADAGRTFHEQPAWQRVIVLTAGSFTHYVVALVLVFAALALVGLPVASNTVAVVTDDSPAATAGLQAGDEIVAVDGRATPDFAAVREAVVDRPGETVTMTVLRDGQREQLSVTLAAETPEGREVGFLGVAPTRREQRLPVGEALLSTVSGDFSVVRLTEVTVEGLGQAFSPEGLASWFGQVGSDDPRSLEGPTSLVGVGQAVDAFGGAGDVFAVLIIFAQLNIVLGLLNMLPLPPLDGGHVAVLAVEEAVNGVRRFRGRPGRWQLNPAVVTPIALAVILFFVVLSVTAIYVDITKPITDALN